MKNYTIVYRVFAQTTVDRPERRDSSYAVVAAGTKIATYQRRSTRAAAIKEFDRMVAGDDDFSSEFVSIVEVYSTREDAQGNALARGRTICRVVRDAPLDRRAPLLATLARGLRCGNAQWVGTRFAAMCVRHGRRVVAKGRIGIAYETDASTYAVPMVRVVFADGVGWMKPSELRAA